MIQNGDMVEAYWCRLFCQLYLVSCNWGNVWIISRSWPQQTHGIKGWLYTTSLKDYGVYFYTHIKSTGRVRYEYFIEKGIYFFVCFITKSFLTYSFFPPIPAISTISRPLSSSMCSITPDKANVGSSYNRMRGPGIGCWFSDRSNCSHWSLTLTLTLTSENISLYTTLLLLLVLIQLYTYIYTEHELHTPGYFW